MRNVLSRLLCLVVLLVAVGVHADVLAPPREPVETTLTGKLVRVNDVSAAAYKVVPPKGGEVALGEAKAIPAGVDAEKLVGKTVQVVAITQEQPLKRGESVLIVKKIKSIKEVTP